MKRLGSVLVIVSLIFVSFMPLTSEASRVVYRDVPLKHSNYADILYLYDKKVLAPATNLNPNVIVTREEAAVLLAKAKGLNGKTPVKTKFKDVPKSNKNSGYIQAAANAGYIKGYPDGTFNPKQKLTRGHMAAFMERAFKLPTGDYTFSDVNRKHTAYNAVKKLVAAGITTGYTDGTFKPSRQLSRAHSAAFISRAMKYETRGTAPIYFPLASFDVIDYLYSLGLVPDGYAAMLTNVYPGIGYTVHVFEHRSTHISTYDWYDVNMFTGKVTSFWDDF